MKEIENLTDDQIVDAVARCGGMEGIRLPDWDWPDSWYRIAEMLGLRVATGGDGDDGDDVGAMFEALKERMFAVGDRIVMSGDEERLLVAPNEWGMRLAYKSPSEIEGALKSGVLCQP